MTLLHSALEEKLMDVRLRDRHLHDGRITREQVADYLGILPDDEDKMEIDKDDGPHH